MNETTAPITQTLTTRKSRFVEASTSLRRPSSDSGALGVRTRAFFTLCFKRFKHVKRKSKDAFCWLHAYILPGGLAALCLCIVTAGCKSFEMTNAWIGLAELGHSLRM
jgi:hypothetical protein